jgi:hypothetical protein
MMWALVIKVGYYIFAVVVPSTAIYFGIKSGLKAAK